MSSSHRRRIINSILDTDTSERESIIKNVLPLITPEMQGNARACLIDYLRSYSDASQRVEITSLALQLVSSASVVDRDNHAIHAHNIIKALHGISDLSEKRSYAQLMLENPHLIVLWESLSKIAENSQRLNIIQWIEKIGESGEISPEILKQMGASFTVDFLGEFSGNEERDRFINTILETGIFIRASHLSLWDRWNAIRTFKSMKNDEEIIKLIRFFLTNSFFDDKSCEISDLIIRGFSDIPSADRQGFLSFILDSGIITPTMNAGDRSKMVGACLQESYSEKWGLFSRRVMSYIPLASELFVPEMEATQRSQIINILFTSHIMQSEGVCGDIEQSLHTKGLLVSYASQLFTQNMTSENRVEILQALCQGRSNVTLEMLHDRFRSTVRNLQEATHRGIITPDNIFTYTYEFLNREANPDQAAFGINAAAGAANIDIVGQEAIAAQRRAITETYENLTRNAETASIISQNLPSLGTENEVFVVGAARLNSVLEFLLKTHPLPALQKMKLINALLGLSIVSDQSDSVTLGRVRGLSSEVLSIVDQLVGPDNVRVIPRHAISNAISYRQYTSPGLPNIRQFFGLVYNLLDQQMGAPSDPRAFVRGWLVETFANNLPAWDKFKKSFQHDFPGVKLPGTVGETLEHVPFLETHLVSCLEKTLARQDLDESVTHKDHLITIRNIAKSYSIAFKEKQVPLLEALVMIMRGHNVRLDSLNECNRPACSGGAYLGIAKTLQEIPDVKHIVGSSLANIDVVACGGGVRQAATVSEVQLGAGVQETLAQERALRAAQDEEYAASLAANMARARITEQGAAAAEASSPELSANDLVPQPEETREQRRERLAVAAEKRKTQQ